jgi:HK97 gp10 family phage protein
MIEFDASDLVLAVTQTADQIAGTLDEQALRKIGFTGAEMFRDEAKRNAQSHIQTGTLHRNIIVKRLDEESDGDQRQVYLVTVRKGNYGGDDAFYWRWVESGHKFVPKKKRGITWKAHRRAAELEYGTATVPAYPFMRPAYESMKGAATDAMTHALTEQLQRNATT